ncbi:MAG: hypothetical protein KI786_08015, partial [Mameliella sp.]|nr:hypothetical protein [Phaeodactylibacter sp.]
IFPTTLTRRIKSIMQDSKGIRLGMSRLRHFIGSVHHKGRLRGFIDLQDEIYAFWLANSPNPALVDYRIWY